VTDEWAELRKTEIPLYDGVPPGSEGWTQTEGEGWFTPDLRVVRNVTRATLTPFLVGAPASGPNGAAAVIIAPGGAFRFLSWDHEGIDVARWLNAHGVAAFVLKYRLFATGDAFPNDESRTPPGPRRPPGVDMPLHPLVREDARRAIRTVRRRAGGWGVDPGRVGIMGFSAGGYVTTVAASDYSSDSRPDFAAPIYGVAPVDPVPADAPPLFLACAADDAMASQGCRALFDRWREAGRDAELHVYRRGGHGFGMRRQGLPTDAWIERFHDWLMSLD
jgi:acetyl esterase/lipase